MSHQTIVLPPHSIEAEQSLIGGLLIDNNSFDRIAEIVSDGDFYRDDHRRIFRHISALLMSGKPADVVTVFGSIDAAGEAERMGGLAYLGDIANNTPSAANIRAYATTIRDRAYRRRGQGEIEALAVSYAAGGLSHEDFAAGLEQIAARAIDTERDEPAPLATSMQLAVDYIERRAEQRGQLAGLSSGLRDVDKVTGGFEPGQLVILAARPAVGKTALALGMADAAALAEQTVLMFSLEMPKRELAMRLMAQRTGVSIQAMRTGTRVEDYRSVLARELSHAQTQRLFIDDKHAVGLAYVRARAKRIQRMHGLGLIVIDYIGLMRGEGQNRTQELGAISRGLKALAKELGVPIIACAQLNRGTEARPDHRPQLHDLRDSGEIEQDADIVLMLHREETTNNAPEWRGLAEVFVRKNRNGPTGEIRLRYEGEKTRFSDYTGPDPRALPPGSEQKRARSRGFTYPLND